MKSQRPKQARTAGELLEAAIAIRYFNLQKLRDEVRKAEISCGLRAPSIKECSAIGAASKFRSQLKN
jgi:hypothetical protein